MDLPWNSVETTQGVYNFAASDALYRACAARGIHVMFILDYGNSLYGNDPTSATWLNGFTNYAAAAAAHYEGDGNIWEVWNEPDVTWPTGSNPTQYMNLVDQVVPAMRAADPNSTIVAPALSGFNTAYMQTCFSGGLLNLVNGVSVHPYGIATPEAVASSYATVRALINQYHPGGTVPIVSSEWGYPNTIYSPGLTAQQQGDYLARSFSVNLSQGIPLSIWYDWKNDGTNALDPEQNFGMVTADLVPKPAYAEMQLLTESLNGEHFTAQLNDGNPNDWLLVFTSPSGQETLAAWTTGDPDIVTDPTWGTLDLTSTPVYVNSAPTYVNSVPEPSTFTLLAVGLASWPMYTWLRKQSGRNGKGRLKQPGSVS